MKPKTSRRIRVIGTEEYGDFVGWDPLDRSIAVLRFSNGWGPYIGYPKDKLDFGDELTLLRTQLEGASFVKETP